MTVFISSTPNPSSQEEGNACGEDLSQEEGNAYGENLSQEEGSFLRLEGSFLCPEFGKG